MSLKRKYYFLIASIGLMSIFTYKLAIKKTMNLYFTKKDLIEMLEQQSTSSKEVESIDIEMQRINKAIGTGSKSKSFIQERILSFLSNYIEATNILLTEFPDSKNYKKNDINLITTKFVVQGGFNKLLIMLDAFEKEIEFGKVASVKFDLVRGPKLKNALELTLIIQTIEKTSYEK
jgi:hypothetical protein